MGGFEEVSIQMNKESYTRLVKENISWLLDNTDDSLERRHIIDILNNSINTNYPRFDDKDNTEEWSKEKWKAFYYAVKPFMNN